MKWMNSYLFPFGNYWKTQTWIDCADYLPPSESLSTIDVTNDGGETKSARGKMQECDVAVLWSGGYSEQTIAEGHLRENLFWKVLISIAIIINLSVSTLKGLMKVILDRVPWSIKLLLLITVQHIWILWWRQKVIKCKYSFQILRDHRGICWIHNRFN